MPIPRCYKQQRHKRKLSVELSLHARLYHAPKLVIASAPMKFPGRFTSGVLMLITSCAALAQSELDVRIKPSNDELKANIEGYIGSLGDRDEEALLRFSRGAEEQARKAAQALGYYQPQIESDVKGGKTPRLVLNIDPGEPVHLRNVTLRVDGPAASLKAFRVPASDDLKSGAVLNHGHYEDAKRLIQNQASRYGFFSGRFTSQKLA